MGIFTHDKGTIGNLTSTVSQLVWRQIGIIVDSRLAAVGITEWQGDSVEGNNGIVHRLQVRAYPTLVAHTPHDDAGMVLVALNETDSTIHMGLAPFGILAHHVISIAIAMTLLIGLVHDIDAPAVAEFVEVLAIGIMRGTQEIDVSLLHQAQVLFVGGIINITARYRMMVVTIHTTQFHILAIDLKHLAHALHTLHTQMVVEVLYRGALRVL